MIAGRIRPRSRCVIPPFLSQIVNSTKPPPAVRTHAINAAHFISPPSVGLCLRPDLPGAVRVTLDSHAVDEDDGAAEPAAARECHEPEQCEHEPSRRDASLAVAGPLQPR